MSIVVMCVRPENYILISGDGLASDPLDGTVIGYASKIVPMQEIQTVMAVTGLKGLGQMIQFHMPAHISSFDEMVEILPELLRDVCDKAEASGMVDFADFKSCIAVGGWSNKRQQYEGWRVLTYEKNSVHAVTGEETTLLPFTALQIEAHGVWASHNPGPDLMRQFGITGSAEDDTDMDLLVRWVCCGRANSGPNDAGEFFNAGGFVQVAMLTRDTYDSKIEHRWPEDVIGVINDPSKGQPLPDNLMHSYNAQA